MSNRPTYSLEDDIVEQAEAACRDLRNLPDQLAKLREQLEGVKARLAMSGGAPGDTTPS